MRAFLVRLPSGARYWTVLDEDLAVVGEADAFLRHVRFGRDGAELDDQVVCGRDRAVLALVRPDRPGLAGGVAQLGLFITWLRARRPQAVGVEAVAGGGVLAGPGAAPARSARRVNGVLTAVRGFVAHAVAAGQAPGAGAAAV